MPRTSIPLVLGVLVVGLPLLGGCRGTRGVPRARPGSVAAAPSHAPTDPRSAGQPAQLRLRYYDLKDLETKNGIMVVRGTPEALREIDQHLSAIRVLHRASADLAATQAAERALNPPKPDPKRGYTVMIHVVNDLLQGMTSEALLATVKAGVGEAVWAQLTVRLQGTSALVVKGPRASHERVAAVLERLRSAK